jgi:beta-phosphoglucomutase family hydrolase
MLKLDDEFFANYDAVLFDLDGVITDTASVHSSAWKQMFDAYLIKRAGADGKFRPFDPREIHLAWGDPSDTPEQETICGLGNRKNQLVNKILETDGVFVFPGSVAMLKCLRERGTKMAVVSSSKNCETVLRIAGLLEYFEVSVDGRVAAERMLPGKPAPDTFLEACREFGVDPKRAVVIEDALSGVEAGRAGRFGLVIGVSRHGDAESLKAAGADIVVPDLAALLEN